MSVRCSACDFRCLRKGRPERASWGQPLPSWRVQTLKTASTLVPTRTQRDSGELVMANQLHPLQNRRQPVTVLILVSCLAFLGMAQKAAAQGAAGNKPPVENKMPQDTIDSSAQETKLGPPTVPVEQIIKQFAAKEAEF